MTTQRAAVRDELLADLAGVTSRIVTAIRREIPSYDALDPALLAEVKEIAAWGVGRVLSAWVADSTLTEDDLTRFRGIGAARAMDGRPLPGVLRAYHFAGLQVTDLVAERAAGRLTVDDALALARLWMTSIDALSEALHDGHHEATERMAANPGNAMTDLLDDLVTGRNATTAAVAARTRTLGITLPAHLTLLVARSPRGAHDLATWRSVVAGVRKGHDDVLQEGLHGVLCGVRDDLLLAVTGDVEPEALRTHVAHHGWDCVMQSSRAETLARHHRDATHTLSTAPRWVWTQNRVLDAVDVAVLLGATSAHTAHPSGTTIVQRRILDPLLSGPDLSATLEAYLATGSATATATALDCHVQTVRYRLGRIRALTGRDLQRSWDRYVLTTATLMRH